MSHRARISSSVLLSSPRGNFSSNSLMRRLSSGSAIETSVAAESSSIAAVASVALIPSGNLSPSLLSKCSLASAKTLSASARPMGSDEMWFICWISSRASTRARSRPSASRLSSQTMDSWIVSMSKRRRNVAPTAAKLDAAIFWKIVITKPSARPLPPILSARLYPSLKYPMRAL